MSARSLFPTSPLPASHNLPTPCFQPPLPHPHVRQIDEHDGTVATLGDHSATTLTRSGGASSLVSHGPPTGMACDLLHSLAVVCSSSTPPRFHRRSIWTPPPTILLASLWRLASYNSGDPRGDWRTLLTHCLLLSILFISIYSGYSWISPNPNSRDHVVGCTIGCHFLEPEIFFSRISRPEILGFPECPKRTLGIQLQRGP
jgi:hypothetical protein